MAPARSVRMPQLSAGGETFSRVQVPPGRFASISSSGYQIGGIFENGTHLYWGSHDYDQQSWPGRRRGTGWESVSSGGFHTCALRRADGTADCWGHDGFGQSSPPTDERFVSISSGWRHTCALREDGSTVCWGAGDDAIDFGQASPPPDERFASISSGVWHTCALREDGSAVCWGVDKDAVDFGQASPPTDERFVSISSGMEYTCAVTVEGTLVCWGSHSLRVRPS